MLEKKLKLSSAYDSLPKKWDSETIRAMMDRFKIAYEDMTKRSRLSGVKDRVDLIRKMFRLPGQ